MSPSSDGPLTIGVIGSGFAARTVVAAAAGSGLVRALLVCGGSGVDQLCERYSVQRCETVDMMLGVVDAVVVATPHDSHAAYCEQALTRGVHVLCEKPFVTDIQAGERLLELADTRARVLSVNHFQRYRIPNAAVAAFLNRHPVTVTGGQARLVESRGMEPWKGRASSRGFAFGYGVHVIDLLLWWVGERCVEVSARSLFSGGVERSTASSLTFANGSKFSLFTSDLGREGIPLAQPGRALMDFELLTTAGVLDVDSYAGTILRTPEGPQALGSLDTWEDFDSPVRLHAYRQALEQFLLACIEEREPELTARAGLEAVRVLDAIEASALDEGNPVCVS